MFNPYVKQIAEQSGQSEREVCRELRHANLTIEQAQRFGFDTIKEYEEAILDYLYN